MAYISRPLPVRIGSWLWQIILRDTWWVELSSGISLALWAMIVQASPQGLNPTSFKPLLSVASDRVWVDITLAAGAFQLLCLGFDRHWTRAIAAGISGWLLGAMTLNLLQLDHWPGGALAFYGVGMFTNIISLWINIVEPGRYRGRSFVSS